MKTMSSLSLIILLLLVGCSTAKQEILNQRISYRKFKTDRNQNVSEQMEYVYYRLGNKMSCFENAKDTDEIITASAEDIKFVFNYLYRNHGTFTMRQEYNSSNRKVEVTIEDNLKIHYDEAYCKDEWLGIFHNDQVSLVSFRILKIENLSKP